MSCNSSACLAPQLRLLAASASLRALAVAEPACCKTCAVVQVMAPPLKSLNMRVTSLEAGAKKSTAGAVKSPFDASASGDAKAARSDEKPAAGAATVRSGSGANEAAHSPGSSETCSAVYTSAARPRLQAASWARCTTAVRHSRVGRAQLRDGEDGKRGPAQAWLP